jgi:predicted phosphodiesterase
VTVAVIADVHGNLGALDAVLADARARGAETFLDLGDTLDGPLDPVGTADRLLALGALTVRGNHDRMMAERDPATAHALLRPEHHQWLAGFPAMAEHEDIVLFHGGPEDDLTTLLDVMDAAGTRPRELGEVEALLEGIDAPLIMCGHTHTPRLLELPDGRRVLNPGSVGLQAYRETGSAPWAIGSGSPHARYALLHRESGRWRVEPRAVAYPWAEAAALALAGGREDWASGIATGWPPPA